MLLLAAVMDGPSCSSRHACPLLPACLSSSSNVCGAATARSLPPSSPLSACLCCWCCCCPSVRPSVRPAVVTPPSASLSLSPPCFSSLPSLPAYSTAPVPPSNTPLPPPAGACLPVHDDDDDALASSSCWWAPPAHSIMRLLPCCCMPSTARRALSMPACKHRHTAMDPPRQLPACGGGWTGVVGGACVPVAVGGRGPSRPSRPAAGGSSPCVTTPQQQPRRP